MKKNMRLFATLLAAALVLGATGCSSDAGADAKEQFQQIQEASAEMTDYDCNISTTTSLIVEDQTVETLTNMRVQVTGANTEQMVMAMTGTTEVSGQEVEMNSYYSDGYMYMDTMGMQYKMPMDIEDAIAQLESSSGLMDQAMDAYQNVTVEEVDGNRVFTYSADPAKLSDLVAETVNATSQSMGIDASQLEMAITEMSGTVTVDDNNVLLGQTASMVYTMTVEGQTMTMETSMDSTTNNPGEPVVIELPDLSTYQEIDMNSLTETAE